MHRLPEVLEYLNVLVKVSKLKCGLPIEPDQDCAYRVLANLICFAATIF